MAHNSWYGKIHEVPWLLALPILLCEVIKQLLTRLKLPSINPLIIVDSHVDTISDILKRITIEKKQDIVNFLLFGPEGIRLVRPGTGDYTLLEHEVEVPDVLVWLGAVKASGLFDALLVLSCHALLVVLANTDLEVDTLLLQVVHFILEIGILVLQLVGVSGQLVPNGKQATQTARARNMRVMNVDPQVVKHVKPG